jgi:phage-related protein
VKKVNWNSKALDFVRSLDDNTKREIGTLLMLLQLGKILGEPQAKRIKIIDPNAYELRIKDSKGIYRVIYVLNLGEIIFIAHAFKKKTQKIPLKEVQLAIQRLREFQIENK